MTKFIEIISERFILRPLNENDASENYLNWFNDKDVKKFIVSASNMLKLSELKRYIKQREIRNDTLFLGIFEKETLVHIGNIKYEPINFELEYAIMGILIGEVTFRNKGVAKEVLLATGKWLNKYYKIKKIILSVEKDNFSAIQTYTKIGFKIGETPHISKLNSKTQTMVWHL